MAQPEMRRPAAGHEQSWLSEVYHGHAATGNTTDWVYEQAQQGKTNVMPTSARNLQPNQNGMGSAGSNGNGVDRGNVAPGDVRFSRGMSQLEAMDQAPSCMQVIKQDLSDLNKLVGRGCSMLTPGALKNFVVDKLPFFEWLPQYSLTKFSKDLQAGLVVGCMLIPQGMGYADVAGLPFVAGLYSSFAPLFIYTVFGTSRQMGVGPVAIVSLLLASGVPACNMLCPNEDGTIPSDPYPVCPDESTCEMPLVYSERYWGMCTSVALMVGIIQVIAAPLLGFVMNFVPHPVISGFTSAGGLIIAMSQLKDIMGFTIRKDKLQDGLSDFFHGLHKTNITTFTMGIVAVVFLFFMRKLGQGKIFFWTPKPAVPRWAKIVAKLPWAFILVVVYTATVYSLRVDEMGVKITGSVPKGLPEFMAPGDFIDNIPKLISITIQIVIIGYLESIAVETKFATQLGYTVRPSQEGLALGAANVIGGFTMAYPVVGSFSRTATNASYESQSPLCNLITATVIMFTLLFLTPLFYFMPKNVLAAIVTVAAFSLVDLHEPIFLWRSSKKEFLLLSITFCLTAFVALELGIYVAVSLCGIEVLFKSTRPKVVRLSEKMLLIYLPGAAGFGRSDTEAEMLPTNIKDSDILVCRVEGDLTFSAASALKNIISLQFKQAVENTGISSMVFDFRELEIVDTTALNALIALVEEIENKSIAVFIVGVPPGLLRFLEIDHVKEKFKGVEIKKNFHQVDRELRKSHEAKDDEEISRLTDGSSHSLHSRKGVQRYQTTLEHAVNAAIREDGLQKRTRRSFDDCQLPKGDNMSEGVSTPIGGRSPIGAMGREPIRANQPVHHSAPVNNGVPSAGRHVGFTGTNQHPGKAEINGGAVTSGARRDARGGMRMPWEWGGEQHVIDVDQVQMSGSSLTNSRAPPGAGGVAQTTGDEMFAENVVDEGFA